MTETQLATLADMVGAVARTKPGRWRTKLVELTARKLIQLTHQEELFP